MKTIFFPSLLIFLLFSCKNTAEKPTIDEPDLTFKLVDQQWKSINQPIFHVSFADEMLTLTLIQNAAWFNESQGGMYYFDHSGDFDLSATVSVTQKNNPASPVESYSFGGIVARNPASSTENYVHVVTGTGINTQVPKEGFEFKVTTNSVSDYEITHNGSSVHDLRLVREGHIFSFYQKPVGTTGSWNLIESRTVQMPLEIQLGFNIYTAHSGESVADMKAVISNVKLK